MAGGIVGMVSGPAGDIAARHGLELVDVEYIMERGTRYLRIYIYKKDGVGIDDCVAVHRDLEAFLDEKDEILGPYTLEVSSPGYERALKSQADFSRYMGEKVEVRLYTPFRGKKIWSGTLDGFSEGMVSLETEEGNMEFRLEDAAKVKRVFEF
ncbi:MAG: ribosome maturation factor RimP [Clostridia bacterium]|nr:ribosome maturation factor RimP [Clostridia bacterium]